MMNSPNLEIGDVRTSYQGGVMPGPRAERISRLTFESLQQMVDNDLNGFARDYTVEHLAVPPIQVAFNEAPDETIAQTSAEAIYRALLTTI
jgi:hypothetical protein